MDTSSPTLIAALGGVATIAVTHFFAERAEARKLSIGSMIVDLAAPSGSLSRPRYWLATVQVYAAHVAATVAAIEFMHSAAISMAIVLLSLGLLWPTFVVAIKRLRALGYRPWWSALLLVIPIAPLLVIYWGVARDQLGLGQASAGVPGATTDSAG